MRTFLLRILFLANAARLLPHLAVFHLSKNGPTLVADLDRWVTLCFPPNARPRSRHASFIKLMAMFPEYRSLFYYRVGMKGRVFSFLCPPMPTLYISTSKIGPGLFIQHGFATVIAAKEIGANCWINQQVTIGFSNATDHPTLLDNVVVNAGAKIIGDVTVGSNSTVGANAVVVKNVPDNVTVVGVPARIVRRDGHRTDQPLH
ncbi:hypothetical protein IP87_17885 [beta proteobacterium AAP121]|nr:hypothetical protein IP80_10795 [beta proteobacterium AAP65]KPF95007.1 hypothetical protein IP87_17885 [beta proteobacterium AAP121]